jgi:hypothetical protein
MKIDADGGSSSVLEQRVLRRHDERLRVVDDHDSPASFERPVIGALDDLADIVDLDRSAVPRSQS